VKVETRVRGNCCTLELLREGDRYRGRIGERDLDAEVTDKGPSSLIVRLGSRTFDVTYSLLEGGTFLLDLGCKEVSVEILDPLRPPGGRGANAQSGGRQEVRAAMPGKVVAVKVNVGDEVKQGQGMVIVEAMKMENEVSAPMNGRVVAVEVVPGQTVEAGTLLVAMQ